MQGPCWTPPGKEPYVGSGQPQAWPSLKGVDSGLGRKRARKDEFADKQAKDLAELEKVLGPDMMARLQGLDQGM